MLNPGLFFQGAKKQPMLFSGHEGLKIPEKIVDIGFHMKIYFMKKKSKDH